MEDVNHLRPSAGSVTGLVLVNVVRQGTRPVDAQKQCVPSLVPRLISSYRRPGSFLHKKKPGYEASVYML